MSDKQNFRSPWLRLLAAGVPLVLGACVYPARYEERGYVGGSVTYETSPTVVEDERVVVVDEPPPPIEREVIVERPSPFHVWVGGYWHSDGRRYDWRPGRWERPPHGRSAWVPPRYEHKGRGYEYHSGHWR
jgi:hypothetical protein